MRVAGEYASWAGAVTLSPNAPAAEIEIARAEAPIPCAWSIAMWVTGITSGAIEIVIRPGSGRGVDPITIVVTNPGVILEMIPAREISVSARWAFVQAQDVRANASVAPIAPAEWYHAVEAR